MMFFVLLKSPFVRQYGCDCSLIFSLSAFGKDRNVYDKTYQFLVEKSSKVLVVHDLEY